MAKKESRYLRMARYLIANPNASDLEIMQNADIGEATLNYCLDAFESIRQAFKEAGLIHEPAQEYAGECEWIEEKPTKQKKAA